MYSMYVSYMHDVGGEEGGAGGGLEVHSIACLPELVIVPFFFFWLKHCDVVYGVHAYINIYEC